MGTDVDFINNLRDPANIGEARKKAEAMYGRISSDQYSYLRRKAKNDLYFLAYTILGFTKLSKKLHGHLCTWLLRSSEECRFRLLLLPRSHYKTSIDTISDSVRIVLPDDAGDAEWPNCLGTDCRVLLSHEALKQASKFVLQITQHFLSNPLLMGLFPECIPEAKTHRINQYELELPRREKWPEATFDAMGVGGSSQGKHYNFIKCDDLIGFEARDSKAVMDSVKDWFDNIQAFFVSNKRDKLDIIGTRWAVNDLYSHVMKVYGPNIVKYIRAAEEYDEASETFKPIFPEEFSTETLAILKRNSKIYSAQFANNPEQVGADFLPQWIRYYEWKNKRTIALFTGERREEIDIGELDKVVLFDPAMTGEAGILVTGTDHKDRVFILESHKKAWRPPEVASFIFQLKSKWNFRTIAIEEVLFSGLYRPWFQSEMRLRQQYFHITPVLTRQKEKDARVRGLTNYFAAGHIYFHSTQESLVDEYKGFGTGEKYHLLDALAYGPEVWTKPLSKQQWDDYKVAEDELLSHRDVATGY